MATLLHIDTATSIGSVALSTAGKKVAEKISSEQRNHASVIIPFIQEIMKEKKMAKAQLDAVVISSGPGSYTGLRVATSTAKGLCYAWDIPLIAIPTLEMMAYGIREKYPEIGKDALLSPMIDARRKEVFTAVYDMKMKEVSAPKAAILEAGFFREYPNKEIIVAGTGQPKAENILEDEQHLRFLDYECRASHLILPAEKAFLEKKFEDVAYFDPFYLKSVYLPGK